MRRGFGLHESVSVFERNQGHRVFSTRNRTQLFRGFSWRMIHRMRWLRLFAQRFALRLFLFFGRTTGAGFRGSGLSATCGRSLVVGCPTIARTTASAGDASCEKRVRPSFCLRPRGERGSADGTQRSQDDSDRHCGRGAGAAGVHGACLPVMRASTREEMRRISSTSRSSSRLFSIHSR